jgi:hypothetical protein
MTRAAAAIAIVCAMSVPTGAQTLTQRGFFDLSALTFPQTAPNDQTRLMVDALAREEVFVKPAPWVQFAAGIDARANSHDQVDSDWTPDFSDRGIRRPPLSVRRLSATFTRKALTVDAGKQFIRWGKTDIITPTDRFAPRDFLNVISTEFLPVTGVRATIQAGADTIEGVWARFTPSRVPLFNQRWTALPPSAVPLPLHDAGSEIPDDSQAGVRWSHVASAFEFAVSFFDGFNHLPNLESHVATAPPALEVSRVYPATRAYGLDAAMPLSWLSIKGEAEFFTSPAETGADDYVLYVVQLERQSGDWVFVGGYAGEVVTARRAGVTFSPERGMTKSFVARVLRTVDPRRTVTIEGAAHQSGGGLYTKAEYSEARGQHWRVTVSAVLIGGRPGDFLGDYRRNSHLSAAVRYSF